MSKPMTRSRLFWIRLQLRLTRQTLTRMGRRLDPYTHRIP